MGIKYHVNENFFGMWGHKMAYVLGYWYADGSLEDASYLRGKYIRVTSVERYIIEKIKNWMDSKHTVVSLKPTLPNGKKRYLLRIGSHKLYDTLISLGLYPKKSLTIQFPFVPKEYIYDFIRGYLDGDGCVHLQKSRGIKKKIIVKKLSVIFTSGSRLFLEKLNHILRKFAGVSQDKVYRGQRAFQLRYGTLDSIKVFKFLYQNTSDDLFFKRKFIIFIKYFRLRPIRIDDEIRILMAHNNHWAKRRI